MLFSTGHDHQTWIGIVENDEGISSPDGHLSPSTSLPKHQEDSERMSRIEKDHLYNFQDLHNFFFFFFLFFGILFFFLFFPFSFHTTFLSFLVSFFLFFFQSLFSFLYCSFISFLHFFFVFCKQFSHSLVNQNTIFKKSSYGPTVTWFKQKIILWSQSHDLKKKRSTSVPTVKWFLKNDLWFHSHMI